MGKIFLNHFSVVVLLLSSSSFAESNEPAMFLCIDSMMQVRKQTGCEPQKLVYGYIDGKKTACMSEYEFRVACSKVLFDRENGSLNKTQKKQLQRNAVYRGEKNLANADLRGLDLKGLDLSGANLTNAQLESADLRGANLKNATMTGANLENAYCKNADFRGADLTSANLRGAFFHHANLFEVQGITMENLSAVSSLYQARLEEPLMEIIESKFSNKLKNPKGSWNQKVYSEQQEIPLSERADPSNFK